MCMDNRLNHGKSESVPRQIPARVGAEEALSQWGFSLQEEKEAVMILTRAESKLAIMQAICDSCGLQSEAQGIVLSLPVDRVVGLE